MNNPAPTDHDVHELIRVRWSPRAFDSRPLDDATLHSLFEAARWAPSCFNEQPWRYIVARKNEKKSFAALLSCLTEKNQTWAQHAPVLAISVASTTFSRNGKSNRHAWHDVGLASAQLTLQAAARGICVHQMAGFLPERAREVAGIPQGFEPVAAMAIGYPGDPAQLPEDLRAREAEPRTRYPQTEFVFGTTWGRRF